MKKRKPSLKAATSSPGRNGAGMRPRQAGRAKRKEPAPGWPTDYKAPHWVNPRTPSVPMQAEALRRRRKRAKGSR